MSGTLDLHIDRGTTYRFQFQYGTDVDGTFTPYDLTSAVVEMFVDDVKLEDTVSISDSTVHLHLSPEQTSSAWEAPYAIYITFASGDVKQPLRGTVFVR